MRISDWSSDVCSSDLEKLLIEACLELMASDAIVAIQDMGAAGLTSSSVEMASKGGVGLHLRMDDVPQRETGMTAYEMMQSESQERMLMVLKPSKEAFAKAIFEKWELDRSEEHTSELQSLMRNSYAVFCLKKKNKEHTQLNEAITK